MLNQAAQAMYKPTKLNVNSSVVELKNKSSTKSSATHLIKCGPLGPFFFVILWASVGIWFANLQPPVFCITLLVFLMDDIKYLISRMGSRLTLPWF